MSPTIRAFAEALAAGNEDAALALLGEDPELAHAGLPDRTAEGRVQRPLHVAVESGLERVAEALLQLGVSADQAVEGAQGLRPLHVAAQHRRLKLAALLVLKGGRPNATDARGRTALHWCAISDARDVARLLLHSGAALDLRDDRGRTARETAEGFGHVSVAEVLVL